jgi:hypothetical protein
MSVGSGGDLFASKRQTGWKSEPSQAWKSVGDYTELIAKILVRYTYIYSANFFQKDARGDLNSIFFEMI